MRDKVNWPILSKTVFPEVQERISEISMFLACEQQTHFRSSLLSLRKIYFSEFLETALSRKFLYHLLLLPNFRKFSLNGKRPNSSLLLWFLVVFVRSTNGHKRPRVSVKPLFLILVCFYQKSTSSIAADYSAVAWGGHFSPIILAGTFNLVRGHVLHFLFGSMCSFRFDQVSKFRFIYGFNIGFNIALFEG